MTLRPKVGDFCHQTVSHLAPPTIYMCVCVPWFALGGLGWGHKSWQRFSVGAIATSLLICSACRHIRPSSQVQGAFEFVRERINHQFVEHMGPDIWSATVQCALGKEMAACCGDRRETHQSQLGRRDGPRRMAAATKLLSDSLKKYAPKFELLWLLILLIN